MRIDKFLSDCKTATRRECAKAARAGKISVNGKTVTDASMHINPDTDTVFFDGIQISYNKYIYLMLNKPEGYISATEDGRLPVVTELLDDFYRRCEPHPCGRLDRDTVGLMILTNDGMLSHSLLSPRHHVPKEYRFKCIERLNEDAELLFEKGLTIDGGYECKPSILKADADRLGGIITLTEGKYHQIKRMLKAIGNEITFLERISFAEIPLDASLARGEYRPLTESEIGILKNYFINPKTGE